MGKYAIRSNTFASKLVEHVLGDKASATPPEGSTGTPLESLRYSSAVSQLLAIGPAPAPLKLMAQFMGQVAQLFNQLLNNTKRSACLCDARVTSLERCGELWRLAVDTAPRQEIYAEHVVVCIGALQDNTVVDQPAHQKKVMISDKVLTEPGISQLRSKLPRQGGNVCIVGGSHSAFSCAWVCLNAVRDRARDSDEITPCTAPLPCSPIRRANTAARLLRPAAPRGQGSSDVAYTTNDASPDAGLPSIGTARARANSMISNTADTAALPRLERSATISGTTRGPSVPASCEAATSTSKGRSQQQHRQSSQKSGHQRGLQNGGTTRAPCRAVSQSGNCGISVTMLHRTPVRVFYASKREADADNYRDFAQTNRYGQVHAFAGLRGDAKTLHREIIHGRETRVRLCQIKAGGSKSLIARCFDEAHAILVATGYKSRTIPIYDTEKKEIKVRQAQGQVVVNAQGCLLGATDVIPNLYGSGHGYGLPAIYENGEIDGSKGRADGVAVYMRQAATVILSQVLGDKFPAHPQASAPAPESPKHAPGIADPRPQRRSSLGVPNSISVSNARLCASPVRARTSRLSRLTRQFKSEKQPGPHSSFRASPSQAQV